MKPRADRPEPLRWLEAARATVHRNERTAGVVERARWQLEHGPFGRSEPGAPLWATVDVLSRLVDMADEDEPEAVDR